MKKIRFALQVFSLAAMLPICVVLQMHHGRNNLRENKPRVIITEQKENTSTFINTNNHENNQ
jgi:hypothetical protein